MKNQEKDYFIKSIFYKSLLPSIIAILSSVIGQIANTIIVGKVLGAEALSIISLVVPIYYIFATIGNLFGIGGSVVCSSLMGEGKYDKSHKAFTVTYIANTVISLLFSVVTIACLPWLLRLLGTTDALFNDVYNYSIVMIIGGVFTSGVYLAFNFLRLDGRYRSSMMVFIIMAIVNVSFDLLFTIVMKTGIVGISIATSAGAAAAAIMGVVIFFTQSKNFLFVKVSFREIISKAFNIIKVGSPGAVENICILLRSFTLNLILLTGFGALALSAFCVIGSVNAFALSIIAGAAGTIVPFISIFSAQKDTVSIKQVLKLALKISVFMTAVVSIVCIFFPGQIGAVFGMVNEQAQVFVKPAIILFGLSLIPAQVNSIFISLHLSNNQTKLANLLTLLRQFLLIVVFAVLLSKPFGINGVWYSFLAAELLTMVVCAISHFVIYKKNQQLSKWTLLDESAEKNGSYISFSVANSVTSVMENVEKISEFCEKNELSPKRTMLISLSLEEMLNSIRVHSLGNNLELEMSVRIIIYNNILVMRIRNGGKLFNPIDYYKEMQKENENDVDAMLSLADSLGIKMIIDSCDVVDYRTTFGINNLTVIL